MKAYPNLQLTVSEMGQVRSINEVEHGMDLRDYFAAQALAGGLEQGVENDMQTNWWHSPEHIAKRAYKIADAMMEEREL